MYAVAGVTGKTGAAVAVFLRDPASEAAVRAAEAMLGSAAVPAAGAEGHPVARKDGDVR